MENYTKRVMPDIQNVMTANQRTSAIDQQRINNSIMQAGRQGVDLSRVSEFNNLRNNPTASFIQESQILNNNRFTKIEKSLEDINELLKKFQRE